jgi:hypothetical protein
MIVIFMSAMFSGCQSADNEEIPWGVGAKADDGDCPAEADLCWNSFDIEQMKDVLDKQFSLLMDDEEEATVTFEQLLDSIELLSHKMAVLEITRISEIRAALKSISPEEANNRIEELLQRLKTVYFAAHMVPTGARADNYNTTGEDSLPAGKADELGFIEGQFSADGYTDDLRESLNIMRKSSVLGGAYVALLQASGVLKKRYMVMNVDQNAAGPDGSRQLPTGRDI